MIMLAHWIRFYLKPGAVIVWLLLSNIAQGQHKWDGGGNDGQWINPLNWNLDTLPGTEDEVLLDNSIVRGNYIVLLPSGSVSVSILRLVITPAEGDSITLLLPKGNIAVPALQISYAGYGLTLNDRAVFINASGATAGLPVMIGDSIRINNGGRYIHRTGRSHAVNVNVLASAPGTESGIFEFDIPDASGTISLSNRIFGTLMLSAATAARTVNYTAAGTQGIRVRSDFIMNAAVALNLNFSDTFFIEKNFIQYPSTFNCGTTARTLTICIRGNLIQSGGGVITETGSGLPEILLNGSGLQQLQCAGTIVNSVSLTIKTVDCILKSPLRLPYVLRLLNGKMHTTDSSLLILGPGSSIRADSAAGLSFINGPVVKEGMLNEHFLFPVGKGVTMRWLALKNVSGDVKVEFIKSNPQLIGTMLGVGIHHISSIEFWKVSDHLITGGNVELSFDNVNSGGVTELSSLRVAVFESGKWQDAGNSFTTGNAGGAGSVVSSSIGELGSGDRYFTLAASSSAHNPLPHFSIVVSGVATSNNVLLQWRIQSELMPEFFEIEGSADGRNFYNRGRQHFSTGSVYRFRDLSDQFNYYRIKTILKNDVMHISDVIHVAGKRDVMVKVTPTIVKDFLQIRIAGHAGNKFPDAIIVSRTGAVLQKLQISRGGNLENYVVNTSRLVPGMYYVVLLGKTIPFIKL